MNSTILLLLPVLWLLTPAQTHMTAPAAPTTETVAPPCDSVPALNQEIVAFVDSKMRKKVGNGQCWTLAAEALESINAKWDGKFKYGTQLDPDTDCIYPGDIIQFKNVQFVEKQGKTTIYDEMEQHTAIVYEVVEKGHYRIAHQNTKKWGKKVDVSSIHLKNKKKGKMWFYRPAK